VLALFQSSRAKDLLSATNSFSKQMFWQVILGQSFAEHDLSEPFPSFLLRPLRFEQLRLAAESPLYPPWNWENSDYYFLENKYPRIPSLIPKLLSSQMLLFPSTAISAFAKAFQYLVSALLEPFLMKPF